MALPPDPQTMNDDRAEWAQRVLGFCERYGDEHYFVAAEDEVREAAEQKIADLLADFGHYCDRNGLCMQSILSKAARRYNITTGNEGNQFNLVKVTPIQLIPRLPR